MSPLCCGKWSQKKSEYFNPLEMLCCSITVRCSQFLEDLTTLLHHDKVCMYEEMMMNTDNVESSLLTSNLLNIHGLYK